MSLARQLAERITTLRYEDLPPEAVYWSRVAVLDTIGVTLAGSVEAPPRIVEDVLELHARHGPSLIFGTNRRAACLDADAYRDPVVRALLPQVHATPYTGKLFSPDDPFDAEVKVTLTDGRAFSAHVDRPLGRTSANPIPLEHIKAKFGNCARRVLAAQAVAAVSRAIDSFEALDSVREFTKLLEPANIGTSDVEHALERSSA